MVLPPSEAGAEKVTEICASPADAATYLGALGTDVLGCGVTEFDDAEGGPSPLPFVA